MCLRCFTAAALVAVLALPLLPADEPKLADTTERLTDDEAKAVRKHVLGCGPAIATPNAREFPPRRILVVEPDVEAVYKAKPRATARLLLKVVEAGRPLDSHHAVCCLQALVKSPEYAAITAEGAVDLDLWDFTVGRANPVSRREHCLQVCVNFVVEKEKATPKDKK